MEQKEFFSLFKCDRVNKFGKIVFVWYMTVKEKTFMMMKADRQSALNIFDHLVFTTTVFCPQLSFHWILKYNQTSLLKMFWHMIKSQIFFCYIWVFSCADYFFFIPLLIILEPKIINLTFFSGHSICSFPMSANVFFFLFFLLSRHTFL